MSHWGELGNKSVAEPYCTHMVPVRCLHVETC